MRGHCSSLLVILVIILCLFINIFLPILFYGMNIMTGADEIRLFNRGKAIANGEIDILHAWDNQQVFDPYPPGYSIIISEILLLFPGINAFGVSLIYRIALFLLLFSLYFWVGNLISSKIGLLSIFFRATLFQVFSSNPGNYVYLFAYGVYLGGGIYTEISVLLFIIFFLRYYKRNGSDSTNIIAMLMINILHGLTHSSGFYTFTILMIIFTILIIITDYVQARFFTTVTHNKLHAICAIFSHRLFMVVYILLIGPGLIFLIYYYRIIIGLDPDIYKIDNFLPLPLPISAFGDLIIIMLVISGLGFIITLKSRPIKQVVMGLPTIRLVSISLPILLIYLICFISVLVITNFSPSTFAYSSFAVTAVFPAILPSIGFVPIMSFIAGIVLFVIVFLGLVAHQKSKNMDILFISFFYLISYFFFAICHITGIFMPHRAMFFFYMIPILLSLCCCGLPNYAVHLLVRKRVRSAIWLYNNYKKIISIIIVIFLSISLVLRANMDPVIRDSEIHFEALSSVGQITPPYVTNELLDALKLYLKSGDAVLSTPETQAAIYCFFNIRPLCPAYGVELKSVGNQKFYDMVSALYYLAGNSPAQWLQKNNGSLVVIGFIDVNGGPRSIGQLMPPIDKLLSDPNLKLVWQDNHGQKIFKLNIAS